MRQVSQDAGIDYVVRMLPRRIHEVFSHALIVAPDRVALSDDAGAWTYRELEANVRVIADQLRGLGVRAGDRVMIVSENSVALAALLLAASHVDAWAIVANPRLSTRELDEIRDHSGSRRVLFTVSVSKEAAAHAGRCKADVRSIGPLRDIAVSALSLKAQSERVEESPARQVALLIYTSGTTGTPKGVMLSHENLLINARVTSHFREMGSRDKLYLVLPLSHIVGVSLLIMTLMVGGSAHLVSKYDPAAMAQAIAEDGITILNGVPATYQRLLEYKTVAGIDQLDRGALRLIAVSGAPLDLDLKKRVEGEFGLPLSNGYGITECSPGISGVRFDAPRADESVGTALPGVELRIKAAHGESVGPDDIGELHVRGRNVMLGYYRAPDLTSKVIDSEGWFNTGDLARFEGDNLFIVGRTKEMIIRSGFNVYPTEVEAVLNSHNEVVQSAVVGRTANGNEEVVAFAQLLPGSTLTAAELMVYVASQLTSYKRPTEIILMNSLPATSTGKILKNKLAESLETPVRAVGTGV